MSTLHLAHAAPFQWSILLLAALISAAVSIVGYWQNARSKRLDRQRQLFADALRSVVEYREFVYKIRRRSPETDRSLITDALSDVQAQLNLHRATLRIEAPSIATQYTSLVDETRRIFGPHISRAWQQPAPTSDIEMSTDVLDESGLRPFETAYIMACNKHLHRIFRSGRNRKNATLEDSCESFMDQGMDDANESPSQDSVYENSIDDSSMWRFMTTLFGKLGVLVLVSGIALGWWLSPIYHDHFSTALGDMITPAAVMISSAIAIAVWIAGPHRRPQIGKRVANPNDLLGMAWTFSLVAIIGIGLAVIFRTIPPNSPEGILQIIGAFSLAMMGLVLVGLGRLLWLLLNSISRRLPEITDLKGDSTELHH